jgi:pSer/pThr/pTyr-binding forkhead associated (FHA) protein
MAFLVCINNGADRSVLPLGKAVLLIGRDDDADLQLQGTGISRNHASIKLMADLL